MAAPGARVGRMSDRRAEWERERLDPALQRAPERKQSFSTMSDMPIVSRQYYYAPATRYTGRERWRLAA